MIIGIIDKRIMTLKEINVILCIPENQVI